LHSVESAIRPSFGIDPDQCRAYCKLQCAGPRRRSRVQDVHSGRRQSGLAGATITVGIVRRCGRCAARRLADPFSLADNRLRKAIVTVSSCSRAFRPLESGFRWREPARRSRSRAILLRYSLQVAAVRPQTVVRVNRFSLLAPYAAAGRCAEQKMAVPCDTAKFREETSKKADSATRGRIAAVHNVGDRSFVCK
jgi:hypothetical protein